MFVLAELVSDKWALPNNNCMCSNKKVSNSKDKLPNLSETLLIQFTAHYSSTVQAIFSFFWKECRHQ